AWAGRGGVAGGLGVWSAGRRSGCRLTRPPAGRALSPYTTLFRSQGQSDAGRGQVFGHAAQVRAVRLQRVEADFDRGVGGRPAAQDRKSTRLNSSHVKSSYAVFCLKKKNRSTTPRRPACEVARCEP